MRIDLKQGLAGLLALSVFSLLIAGLSDEVESQKGFPDSFAQPAKRESFDLRRGAAPSARKAPSQQDDSSLRNDPPYPPQQQSIEALLHQVENDLQKLPGSKFTHPEEIAAQMRAATHAQIQSLASKVIRPGSQRTRRAAIYLLTKAGPAAIPALTQVASTPIPGFAKAQDPHSTDSLQHNFEVSLRITAIETIDQLAAQNEDVQSEMASIAEHQKDPALRFFAEMSLAGIRENRPGKLGRAINAMFKETVQRR